MHLAGGHASGHLAGGRLKHAGQVHGHVQGYFGQRAVHVLEHVVHDSAVAGRVVRGLGQPVDHELKLLHDEQVPRLSRLGLCGGAEGALLADAHLEQRLVAALQLVELPPRQLRVAQGVAGGSGLGTGDGGSRLGVARERPEASGLALEFLHVRRRLRRGLLLEGFRDAKLAQRRARGPEHGRSQVRSHRPFGLSAFAFCVRRLNALRLSLQVAPRSRATRAANCGPQSSVQSRASAADTERCEPGPIPLRAPVAVSTAHKSSTVSLEASFHARSNKAPFLPKGKLGQQEARMSSVLRNVPAGLSGLDSAPHEPIPPGTKALWPGRTRDFPVCERAIAARSVFGHHPGSTWEGGDTSRGVENRRNGQVV